VPIRAGARKARIHIQTDPLPKDVIMTIIGSRGRGHLSNKSDRHLHRADRSYSACQLPIQKFHSVLEALWAPTLKMDCPRSRASIMVDARS
jgi:hypothetical protein